jgi:hypothetical protein
MPPATRRRRKLKHPRPLFLALHASEIAPVQSAYTHSSFIPGAVPSPTSPQPKTHNNPHNGLTNPDLLQPYSHACSLRFGGGEFAVVGRVRDVGGEDLLRAKITVIQIDEAALREGLPLRNSKIPNTLCSQAQGFLHRSQILQFRSRQGTQLHSRTCFSRNDALNSQ